MDKPTWRGSGEQVVRDLRFGIRVLRRSPVSSLVAVASIALGIGLTTAIFSMLYAIAWRPLPVANPEALVQLQALEAGTGKETSLPAPVLRGLREQRQIFAGVAFDSSDGLAGRIGDRTERVIGEVVTGDFFRVLGVPLFLGHDFSPNADGAAWEPSAIISHGFFTPSERRSRDPRTDRSPERISVHDHRRIAARVLRVEHRTVA